MEKNFVDVVDVYISHVVLPVGHFSIYIHEILHEIFALVVKLLNQIKDSLIKLDIMTVLNSMLVVS